MRSMKFHGKHRRRFTQYPIPLLGIMFAFQIFAMVYFNNESIGQAIISTLPLVLLAIGAYYLIKWRIKQTIRKIPSLNAQVTWTFDDQKYVMQTDHASGQNAWQNVFEAVVFPEGVLIYPQKQLFHWIPREAFRDNYELLKPIISKNVAKHKIV